MCYFHFYVLEDPANYVISTFTVLYTCAYNYVIENPANLCNLNIAGTSMRTWQLYQCLK
jgi:hypothetical protein